MFKKAVLFMILFLLAGCVSDSAPESDVALEAWLEESAKEQSLQYIDPVVVHFSVPMDPDSTGEPLTLKPDIEGSFSWNRDFTELTYQPEPYFPMVGGTYKLKVSEELTSETGEALVPRRSWYLTVEPAANAIRSVNSYNLSYDDPTIVLNFFEGGDESIKEYLQFEPEVEFSIEWSGNRLAVTFEEGGNPEQIYAFTILAGARSSDGKAYKEQTRRFVFTKMGVSIEREVEQHQLDPFKFTFTYPVDRDTFPTAFSADPFFEYRLEWLSDREVLVHPIEPLALGEPVALQVSEELKSKSGVPLREETTYIYTAPSVLSGVGAEMSDGYLIFNVDFVIEPDIESVLSLVQIEPSIKFDTEWDDEDYVFSIRSNNRVLTSEEYTLQIVGEASGTAGFPLQLSVVYPFTTVPITNITEPEESDYYWDEGLNPREPYVINFERAMDRESTQAAISTDPLVDLLFEWESDLQLNVIPQPFFPEGRVIEFEIGPEALDADGNQVLAKSFTWREEFDFLADAISFGISGADAQLVDTDGTRTIDVGRPQRGDSQDFESITVEMVRLSEQQFTDYLEYVGSYADRYYYRDKPMYDTSGMGVQAVWEVNEQDLLDVFDGGSRWGLKIPEHVPDGLYIANLITDHVNDQLAIVASSGSVTAKIGEDTNGAGQIIAWVNNINSYMVQDAEIRVFDRDGVLLSSGETNEIGVFEGNYNLDYEPFIVVAKNERMYTLTGIGQDWQYDYNYWDFWSDFWYTPVIESYLVYTYTDRPIYRPGQTVYYKSILRLDYDVDYSMPATGKEVAVHLRDARGNLVETQQAWLSPFGSIEGSFLINEGAMLGRYTLQVEVEGEIHEQGFKVQEYSKPDYAVEVSTGSENYVQGDTVSIEIDTEYLFGEPVINGEVTVNLYELAQTRYLYDWFSDDIDAGDIDGYDWYETSFKEIQGTTDSTGMLSATFTAPKGRFSNGWYIYDFDNEYNRMYSSKFGIEASVDDGSDQWVSGMAVIEVYSTSAELSLGLNWAAEAGESYPLNIQLESIFGMDIADQTVNLVVEEYKRRGSRYWGEYEEIQESELVTDQDGRITTYLDLESGFYRFEIEARDDRGNLLKRRRYAYILSEDSDIAENYFGGLTLSTMRTDYTAGETAEIMIETPFAGEGLLTIERGGVLDYRVVRVAPPFTIIDVPLYADYAPNVFINFQMWEEIDVINVENEWDYYLSVGESKLRSEKVEINVADVGHKLQMEVTSDKEVYRPGEEATFYIQVTDYQGDPVNTEVSLALVDEAIYLLSSDLVDPIHQAFFSPREHGVASFNSLEPTRWLWHPGMGGGGGAGGGDGFWGQGANPRSDFPDTLVWHPRLITEEDGRVRVTVTLPDSLTTWRVSVKGVTLDTEVGEAVYQVITQQPVVVRPQLPEYLIVGDTFILSALVHNYTEADLTFSAFAECDICEFSSDFSQNIEITSGESEVVGWPVEVIAAGEGTIVISAEADEYGDAVLAKVTAQPSTMVSTVSQSGAFSEEVTLPIDVPEGALPGSQLVIKLDRTISSTLLDGVEYLTGYPFGCIEQTMSRALPNAVVSRAFYQLGLDDRGGMADLDAKIQASIQRLYAFQHDDGGWGWWYDDGSDGYNSAWVVFGLKVTGESGYYIDPGVIERGTIFLQEHLEGMNPATQAFALYAMSMAGAAELEDVLRIAAAFADMDTFSQSALVLTLHQLGEEELAAELLLQILEDLQTEFHGGQFIPVKDPEGYYRRKYMSSEVRSNALLLKAVLAVLPEHESIPGIAEWLMAQRRSSLGWGSTNETAFSMIALTDFIIYEQTSGEALSFSVLLNGREQLSQTFSSGEATVAVSLPLENMNTGENQITLSTDAAVRLYYMVGRKVVSEDLPEDADGVSVDRKYINPKTGSAITSVKKGALVKVSLTVYVPSDAFYILIEDPLPGGLEALNENLALSSHEVTANPYEEGVNFRWTTLGYNNKDIYPDKIVFFITELNEGKHTFEYYARSEVSGEYAAMPTHLSAMYDESFYGYGEKSILNVEE